jgi:oligoendopeptidase F
MKTPLLILSLAFSLPSMAQQKDWDLTDLVKDEKQWKKEMTTLEKRVSDLKKCEGKLGESAKKLQECLELSSDFYIKTSRTCSWAWLSRSTNSLEAKNVENAQRCSKLFATANENGSYLHPEIIKLGKDKVQGFIKENNKLEAYSQFLREILDRTPYVLTPDQEQLLNALEPALRKSSETHDFLLDAEIKWPKVAMSDGEKEVDVATYVKYRQSENREDRKKAFHAFYTTLGQFERTFGSTLSQSVIRRNTEARIRKYDNALHQALSEDNLPESVYTTLVAEVNRSLPTLHRYLKLRQDMLGIKNLSYEDMYVNIMKSPKAFPLDVTQQMTLASAAVLGDDYLKKLTEGTSKNWMSVYPTKGKGSGAFMSSTYSVHPYVFLNHQDDYNSASTYAHEWGHALHSILSDENQPYAKSHYRTFTAEIAAITNEILLNDYALKNAKNDEERLFYLNEALESLRTTYFRQTQFAEFELAIHKEAESGMLTGQKISEIYGQIQRKFYGHDKKVVNVDPLHFKEWMFVGHFYSGFYVFQYSTAMAGAYYFADKILEGDKEVLEKYLTLLKSGGSKYPHELLLDAGLDLTKKEPYRVLEKRAKSYIDQIEKISKSSKIN